MTPLALASMPWGFRSFPGRDVPVSAAKRDPSPGTTLTRRYKGRTLEVLVRDDGQFEYEGTIYRSLTAVATAITGAHWNGRHFFQLNGKRASA